VERPGTVDQKKNKTPSELCCAYIPYSNPDALVRPHGTPCGVATMQLADQRGANPLASPGSSMLGGVLVNHVALQQN
jgi:hypothetical protein